MDLNEIRLENRAHDAMVDIDALEQILCMYGIHKYFQYQNWANNLHAYIIILYILYS